MTGVLTEIARRRPVTGITDRGDVWPIGDGLRHGAPPHLRPAAGLVAGTRVSTEFGWRAVETLRPGDRVLTFDEGLQGVVSVTMNPASPQGGTPKLIHVPKGALGNCAPLHVLPCQRLLIDTGRAEGLIGDPFVLVTAQALVGYKGISAAPGNALAVKLRFARALLVFAEGAAVLHCPATPDSAAATDPDRPGYRQLSPQHEAQLVASLRRGDGGMVAAPAQPWGSAQAARPRLVS